MGGAHTTITSRSGAPEFGTLLSLSGDGSTIFAGEVASNNDAEVFSLQGSAWKRVGQAIKVAATAGTEDLPFPYYSAISTDGSVLAVGSPLEIDEDEKLKAGSVTPFQFTPKASC